jgi:hypothetical protein
LKKPDCLTYRKNSASINISGPSACSKQEHWLLLLGGLLTLLLLSRKEVDGTIVRPPGILYQERGIDSISNLYTIKVINKSLKNIPLSLKLENAPGRILYTQGVYIILKNEDQAKGLFFVVLPNTYLTGRKIRLKVGLYDGDKRITTLHTYFMGPFRNL